MHLFRSLTSLLISHSFALAAADSLTGCYYIDEEDVGTSVLVFRPDGTYHHMQVGDEADGGFTGMERGTYSWNSGTGEFTSSVITDTNGEWGFSHGIAGVAGVIVSVGEDGLELVVPEEGPYSLPRVERSETNPLIGGWWFRDLAIHGSIQEAGGDVVFAFLPDGRYFMCQDGEADDDSGQDGLESGTITWNSETGDFSIVFVADTNGEWGLSNQGPDPAITAGSDGNHLVLDPDENEGEFVILHRITPGSQILSSWIEQQGLSGDDAEPNATPFSDGLPNLVRYALNLTPNPSPEQLPSLEFSGAPIASTAPLARSFSTEEPSIILRYQQRFPLVGVTLVPQSSPDLVEWHDIPVENREVTLDTDPAIIRVSVGLPVLPQNTNPHRFLRLQSRILD